MHIIYPEDFPEEAIQDCSASGDMGEAVDFWLAELGFDVPEEDARAYLRGYGAWDDDELADHAQNRRRIFWIACCHFADGDYAFTLE